MGSAAVGRYQDRDSGSIKFSERSDEREAKGGETTITSNGSMDGKMAQARSLMKR